MVESQALLVDEILPAVPLRQWVLSVPFQIRFMFACHPQIMGKALGNVYRTIATHLIHSAGFATTLPAPGPSQGLPSKNES
jgi:hypothetical protein